MKDWQFKGGDSLPPRLPRRPLCGNVNGEELTLQAAGLKRAAVGVAGAATGLLSGAVRAARQHRDLDGDGMTDASYDTGLKIAWLHEANANETMNRDTAVGRDTQPPHRCWP